MNNQLSIFVVTCFLIMLTGQTAASGVTQGGEDKSLKALEGAQFTLFPPTRVEHSLGQVVTYDKNGNEIFVFDASSCLSDLPVVTEPDNLLTPFKDYKLSPELDKRLGSKLRSMADSFNELTRTVDKPPAIGLDTTYREHYDLEKVKTLVAHLNPDTDCFRKITAESNLLITDVLKSNGAKFKKTAKPTELGTIDNPSGQHTADFTYGVAETRIQAPFDIAYKASKIRADTGVETSIVTGNVMSMAALKNFRQSLRPPGTMIDYDVWYVTTRRAKNPADESLGYVSDGVFDKTHYGIAHMVIPHDYLKLIQPSWWDQILQNISVEDSAESLISIHKLEPKTEQAFWDGIASTLKNDKVQSKDILVFIHGFKNDFTAAAQRAAGLGYYTQMPVTVMYSWPSYDKADYYEADRDAVISSADNFAEFLIGLRERFQGGRIHLVAHSMGNFGLFQALYRPKMQKALADGFRFGQIVLAAADVDYALFDRDGAILTKYADHVTLYASQGDEALKASEVVARNRPRIGRSNVLEVQRPIDTIDVTKVDKTIVGHAYVDTALPVLNDLHKLLNCKAEAYCKDADARGLKASKTAAGQPYWILSDVK